MGRKREKLSVISRFLKLNLNQWEGDSVTEGAEARARMR